jgi:hypothetical protein
MGRLLINAHRGQGLANGDDVSLLGDVNLIN